jgi:flagellar basal body L-ring protein FlgH
MRQRVHKRHRVSTARKTAPTRNNQAIIAHNHVPFAEPKHSNTEGDSTEASTATGKNDNFCGRTSQPQQERMTTFVVEQVYAITQSAVNFRAPFATSRKLANSR